MLEVDEALLEERRRKGLDCFDEMWEGVLHMVPAPSGFHQQLGSGLLVALFPEARSRGFWLTHETGLYRAEDDYRVPDLVAYRPEAAGRRGVEGIPELVVELRSPGDETDAKLPWYLALGTPEVLIVDSVTLALQLHRQDGPAYPDADGWVALTTLDARLRTVAGALEVQTAAGTVEVPGQP